MMLTAEGLGKEEEESSNSTLVAVEACLLVAEEKEDVGGEADIITTGVTTGVIIIIIEGGEVRETVIGIMGIIITVVVDRREGGNTRVMGDIIATMIETLGEPNECEETLLSISSHF